MSTQNGPEDVPPAHFVLEPADYALGTFTIVRRQRVQT